MRDFDGARDRPTHRHTDTQTDRQRKRELERERERDGRLGGRGRGNLQVERYIEKERQGKTKIQAERRKDQDRNRETRSNRLSPSPLIPRRSFNSATNASPLRHAFASPLSTTSSSSTGPTDFRRTDDSRSADCSAADVPGGSSGRWAHADLRRLSERLSVWLPERISAEHNANLYTSEPVSPVPHEKGYKTGLPHTQVHVDTWHGPGVVPDSGGMHAVVLSARL